MKNYFKISIMVIFSLLTLCSCKRIDEKLSKLSITVPTAAEVEDYTHSTESSISATSHYDLDEVTNSDVEDAPHPIDSLYDSSRKHLPAKELHSLAESLDCIVYLTDIFSELPNADVSYFNADLPDKIQFNLNVFEICFLEIDDYLIPLYRGQLENYLETLYWGNYTFISPKLYYNNGQLYILAKELYSGHLFKISVDPSIGLGVQDTFLYADTLNLENANIISYLSKSNYTFVQKDDSTYSFYCLGEEMYNLDINAKPENIIFNKPFIDNNNNLFYIVVNDIENCINCYVDTDVCTLYNYRFYNIDYGDSFVYEKNDGKSYLLSHHHILHKFNIYEIESTDFISKFHFTVDEFNRCFIYPKKHIETEINGFPETFTSTSGEYVCDIPVEKLDEYKLNQILTPTFSYSEKDSRIEELLTYINQ